jgi:hypothetical protein
LVVQDGGKPLERPVPRADGPHNLRHREGRLPASRPVAIDGSG